VTFTRFALALIACHALWAQADPETRVTGIVDGDTIHVSRQGVDRRVRLWGIDAPEVHQSFGASAKRFTRKLASRKTVTLQIRDVDRYGRIVAEVILPDGRNLNQEIVRAGLAWRYQYYARREQELKALETEARAAKRGLWAARKPLPPWEYRRIHR
jgi:micrococcal nuclease